MSVTQAARGALPVVPVGDLVGCESRGGIEVGVVGRREAAVKSMPVSRK